MLSFAVTNYQQLKGDTPRQRKLHYSLPFFA